MSDRVFVPAPAAERGEVASYLVALANEKGISTGEIKKACENRVVGYLVPAELLAESETIFVPFKVVDAVDDGSGHVLPESEVVFDGKDFVINDDTVQRLKDELADEAHTEFLNTVEWVASEPQLASVVEDVDREVVRDWAKANGFQVAEKGALKKTVLEAYAAAHA